MTKQTIIALTVGIIIILGAFGAYFYSRSKTPSTNTTVASQVTPTPANSNAMQQSIAEIFASGKNSQCTFSTTGTSGSVNGTVYTSADNARADFNMTTESGRETTSHMIKSGDTFYMWGDSFPVGMKMVMNVDDLTSKLQGNPASEAFDTSKKVDIKCVSWTTDAKLFTPPSNVKFTTLPAMSVTGAKTTGTPTAESSTENNTNQCNICSALTGNAKSACMTQFNCK